MSTLRVDIGHRAGDFVLRAAFEAHPSGVTALFGPSGAGKSTLIDALAGLIRPRDGRIALGDEVLFDAASKRFVPPERRRMGCVFQRPCLFPHLRVRDNCLFGARRRGAVPDAVTFERVVDLLDIGALLMRRPRGLSGGERQRVAMARALLSAPRMLLLDEPLAAVDEARRREILPYLERLRAGAGVPIVYVSHSVAEVTRLADTVVRIEGGTVTAAGAVDAVLAADAAPFGDEPGAAIAARVARHDEGDALTVAAFEGGELVVPRVQVPVGAPLRLFVGARDVMLSLTPLDAVSANNVLRGRITTLAAVEPAQTDVHLDCGGAQIVARVTRASARRLGLANGQTVFAAIKTLRLSV